MSYTPKHSIRIVTAASLFDGHDAAINIMRRILQDAGAEVIHLGHNRSVEDVVKAALQEGAQGICVSSYQGGHMEYFKYMKDQLDAAGASYVRIYGGGGGVIIHEEKAELEKYGIAQIFHPDDGRRLGLEGMIEQIIKGCDFDVVTAAREAKSFTSSNSPLNTSKTVSVENLQFARNWGLDLTMVEEGMNEAPFLKGESQSSALVLGVTGTGGAGKSSLVDELVTRFLNFFPSIKIGIVCVDPTKRKTGGALLGDRIRMNSLAREGVLMRSLASRGSGSELSQALPRILDYCKHKKFDLLIAETSGIGQASSKILEVSDISLYVMTSEFGAQSQLEKIDMIDFADFIAINKADRRGALDAHRDVEKQYKRSRKLFDPGVTVPVHLTQASNFNDQGVNGLFLDLVKGLNEKAKTNSSSSSKWTLDPQVLKDWKGTEKNSIIPPHRQNYLAEIVSKVRQYKNETEQLAAAAQKLGALEELASSGVLDQTKAPQLKSDLESHFEVGTLKSLREFPELVKQYSQKEFVYKVRDKEIRQPLTRRSLCGLDIPRVALPDFKSWGERLKFLRLENLPGEFPYTSGVFPLKRTEEDPTRQFAGEGGPERTNRRFHFLSQDSAAKRLSTAFDSVTLYGQDPNLRPDIYGKVGESGVSIATLEDMKKLYEGFDLCDPQTSVSMTINGPAPMILAFFMNTAIDGQVDRFEAEHQRKVTEAEYQKIKLETLQKVRGTVQADILKEDQGQNTCIFSIDFALRMMGDIQSYFIENKIRNFYSVSISGYHIAEAGANPITQLALTLSNAFTYVEYYRARGLKVDDFAPNFSFFFSNGLDPEYAVIGRVARRIWAIAMKEQYQANDRSQKLKYHIQTSGRSLHAQEIAFNDIRTTLQALLAISDNCNSLHTNAYDEAITTPTEESVRRAQAIQMIINKEFGYNKNENPLQGSYFINQLTDMVEEAVLEEFMRLNERGGVLGAMETQYQRSRIQEESLYYEMQKHDGTLPLIGVNTFIDPKTLAANYVPPKIELARASAEEKKFQLEQVEGFQKNHLPQSQIELKKLKEAALGGRNVFEALMSAARHCSLYQMTQALYEVGGQYRRNI